MLLPEDDLQLAACLKSPLIGLTEDDADAARRRPEGTAFGRRCRRAAEDVVPRRRREARRWRAMADQVTPFRFFATVLGPDGGRRAFRARLGGEADDVLDAFLSQALAYESDRAAVAAGLSPLRPRQRERHQARGRGGERRRARHDRARRQGARGGRGLPRRHRRPDRRAGPARPARPDRHGRATIRPSSGGAAQRGGAGHRSSEPTRAATRRRGANICACSTSR